MKKYSLDEEKVFERMADYRQGRFDCDNGIRHKEGMGADYDRGYADKYAMEQVESQMCMKQGKGQNHGKRNTTRSLENTIEDRR